MRVGKAPNFGVKVMSFLLQTTYINYKKLNFKHNFKHTLNIKLLKLLYYRVKKIYKINSIFTKMLNFSLFQFFRSSTVDYVWKN